MPRYFLLILALFCLPELKGFSQSALLEQGWKALLQDEDTLAIRLFSEAFQQATLQNQEEQKAEALLYLGMASYGTSLNNGAYFAHRSLRIYSKLAKDKMPSGRQGVARCQQLLSTIAARRGEYQQVYNLSMAALEFFQGKQDSTGTLGLIYLSLAAYYQHQNQPDSVARYVKLALQAQRFSGQLAYLPNACIRAGDLALAQGNRDTAYSLFLEAQTIAEQSRNQQALVQSKLAFSRWHLAQNHRTVAQQSALSALAISRPLRDRSYAQKAYRQLALLAEKAHDVLELSRYRDSIQGEQVLFHAREQEELSRSLELQFEIREKEAELHALRAAHTMKLRLNLLLGVLLLLAGIALLARSILFRRIRKRDMQLLEQQQQLVLANEEQTRLREAFLQNEIDHRENKLSALALQMYQKNSLLQEMQERLESSSGQVSDNGLKKLIQQGLAQEKDWDDFSRTFESLNKNFYQRLKELFPDISPSELRLCALIKMDLSIKESAAILNISPDSVKTARYRLRKKLNLQTEDNLSAFIRDLS